jgi:hypothetical protein
MQPLPECILMLLLTILLQTIQIILPICITVKYDMALIAPADHVVKRSGKFYSRLARRGALICHDR